MNRYFINKKSDKEIKVYNSYLVYILITCEFNENLKYVNKFLTQVCRNGEEEFIKHFLFIHIKKIIAYDDFLLEELVKLFIMIILKEKLLIYLIIKKVVLMMMLIKRKKRRKK